MSRRPERDEQHDRERSSVTGKSGEERVLGGTAPFAGARFHAAYDRDHCVRDEPEGKKERGAPEEGHQVLDDLPGP